MITSGSDVAFALSFALVQTNPNVNVSLRVNQVSVIKAKLHEELGMPAGKQKLQHEVCARSTLNTLGPVYNEHGYNEHPTVTSRFLCIKIIDRSVTRL